MRFEYQMGRRRGSSQKSREIMIMFGDKTSFDCKISWKKKLAYHEGI
jgi:hypothetical protein